LLVVEGTDGGVSLVFATDDEGGVVTTTGAGYGLPIGSHIKIVVGPYTDESVSARLITENGEVIPFTLERLTRTCRFSISIPEGLEGELVIEIIVDGEVVAEVALSIADSVTTSSEVESEDVLAALDAVVNHFEEGLSVSGVTEIVTEFVNAADDGGAQAEDDEDSHADDEGAQEDQDVPAEGIDVELPATGSDTAQVAPIAALALSVGVLLWLVRRRVSG